MAIQQTGFLDTAMGVEGATEAQDAGQRGTIRKVADAVRDVMENPTLKVALTSLGAGARKAAQATDDEEYKGPLHYPSKNEPATPFVNRGLKGPVGSF